MTIIVIWILNLSGINVTFRKNWNNVLYKNDIFLTAHWKRKILTFPSPSKNISHASEGWSFNAIGVDYTQFNWGSVWE